MGRKKDRRKLLKIKKSKKRRAKKIEKRSRDVICINCGIYAAFSKEADKIVADLEQDESVSIVDALGNSGWYFCKSTNPNRPPIEGFMCPACLVVMDSKKKDPAIVLDCANCGVVGWNICPVDIKKLIDVSCPFCQGETTIRPK